MPETRSLNVTLPSELADAVEAKVASGSYASQNEIIEAGLTLLLAQEAEVESWLRNEVAATYDAYMRDPSRARSADDVLARLGSR